MGWSYVHSFCGAVLAALRSLRVPSVAKVGISQVYKLRTLKDQIDQAATAGSVYKLPGPLPGQTRAARTV